MNITRHSEKFKELADQMHSGAITREQMADTCGVKVGTLGVWLTRSKLTKKNNADGTKKLHGSAADNAARLSPETAKLLDDLTKKVLDGTYKSCLAAHTDHKDVSLSTLTVRVRKARIAQGLPIGRQGKKTTQ